MRAGHSLASPQGPVNREVFASVAFGTWYAHGRVDVPVKRRDLLNLVKHGCSLVVTNGRHRRRGSPRENQLAPSTAASPQDRRAACLVRDTLADE
jgi:hypothetical protein